MCRTGLTNHELILSAVASLRVFGNKPSHFTYCNHHIDLHTYQQSNKVVFLFAITYCPLLQKLARTMLHKCDFLEVY